MQFFFPGTHCASLSLTVPAVWTMCGRFPRRATVPPCGGVTSVHFLGGGGIEHWSNFCSRIVDDFIKAEHTYLHCFVLGDSIHPVSNQAIQLNWILSDKHTHLNTVLYHRAGRCILGKLSAWTCNILVCVRRISESFLPCAKCD